MEPLLQVFTVAPSAGAARYCTIACDTVQSGMHSNTLRAPLLVLVSTRDDLTSE